MSNPNPTSLMGDWLSDNLADWLFTRFVGGKNCRGETDLHRFVQLCVLPHLSPYGVNSMYEFLKEDYDDEALIDPKM